MPLKISNKQFYIKNIYYLDLSIEKTIGKNLFAKSTNPTELAAVIKTVIIHIKILKPKIYLQT